ncbi:VTC domain protein [Planctomycetes bacterium Pla163]|uniref:VTC domain protein n=1 Tax=Rohdeia mirabilis TaxID=2528008 RepID=A0A518CX69_9BACT|nr:VTC domain protein [Planctomycetes bacterium Pla163]
MSKVFHSDGTLRSRFECKYVVEPSELPALREFFSTFMEQDENTSNRPLSATGGRAYTVSSLYLDSPRLALYQDTVDGAKNRFKLRLRTYDDAPESPVFCEVKKRMDGVIYKRRAPVSRTAVAAFLDGEQYALERESDTVDAAEFSMLTRRLIARPTLRVHYQREAWESRGADPVRVTFDTELRYADSPNGELSCEDGDWRQTYLTNPILEIKFTNTFPGWLGNLARRFGLVRRSVAKYVICVNAARRTEIGALRYRAS